jgi:hypothetical protein
MSDEDVDGAAPRTSTASERDNCQRPELANGFAACGALNQARQWRNVREPRGKPDRVDPIPIEAGGRGRRVSSHCVLQRCSHRTNRGPPAFFSQLCDGDQVQARSRARPRLQSAD